MAILLSGCDKKEAEKGLELVTEPIFIAEGVRGVDIVKQDKEIMNIAYEQQEYESPFEFWKMDTPYNDEVIVDTEAMIKLYQQLVMIDMQKIEADASVKFDKPLGKISIEFCQTTEDEREAAVMGQEIDKENSPSYQVEADSKAMLLIGDNDGRGNYYVAYEGAEDKVYTLNEMMVDAVLDVIPFDYILDVSAVADIETMKSVTIKQDGKTYKISEKQLKEQEYRSLYNEMFSIFVIEENLDASKMGKDAIIEMAFKRNVKGAPDLHISYHSWDEEKCAVKVNGDAFFLVNSDDVEALKTKIEEVLVK